MVLLIPRVLFDYEEVRLKEEMLQREDKRDWKAYCCYQIFERVSHVTFKEKNIMQEVETCGSYFVNQSKEDFSNKISQSGSELVLIKVNVKLLLVK